MKRVVEDSSGLKINCLRPVPVGEYRSNWGRKTLRRLILLSNRRRRRKTRGRARSLNDLDSADMNLGEERRGEAMNDMVDAPIVAVIDGCRHATRHFDRDELTFLSSGALVEYKGVLKLCKECSEQGKVSPSIGINGHGFFCASIIGSPEFHNARLEKLQSSTLSTVSPPRVSIYAIGCPCCTVMDIKDIAEALDEVKDANVNVISMSLMRGSPAKYLDQAEPDFNLGDDKILQVTMDGILVVLAAGNYGNHGFGSIHKSPPWCLTVAACTSCKKFKTTIGFVSDADVDLHSLEGQSTSMVILNEEDCVVVRKKGDIHNTRCVMYISKDRAEIVVEASEEIITTNPWSLVHISPETSTIISSYLDRVAAKQGSLLAYFPSSSSVDLHRPSVSDFSGWGPCSYYKECMKPDLCAPGEGIVAAWPLDVTIDGERDDGKPGIARYTVGTGTSFFGA
ncbi:hypothetical protein POM88_036605 [Heracleum sosnowskyi]|uniref:Peptidase S8/S53 domain-containing protein n=1 Tax=Heracleum sosnowskyi TaxID=360622 RepID=A0AAD8HQD2_9APIA|nr:hypothetical protein POM88_036605 [Heracleum sosnowskyi]